jgi:putative transposase
VLGEPAARAALCEVLGKFDGVRYEHHAWVVMPNHVHALFSPAAGESLGKTLQGWKGVSARKLQGTAGNGNLWQKDYFDRLIRDAEHFWRVARYIRRNPARLPAGRFTLFESEPVRKELDREDAMRA